MNDLEPALFSAMPRADYDRLVGLNSSLLKVGAVKTALHARRMLMNKGDLAPARAALRQGILLHQRLLEPAVWETVRTTSSGPTSKAYLDFARKAEADGAVAAHVDEYEMVMAMADSVLAHETLGPLFAPTPENVALNELTLSWADPATGEPCKARLDAVRITDEGILCLDLKSTMDAGPIEFGKSAANFMYHLQASFYADGLYYCAEPLERFLNLPSGALQGKPVTFEFVAIEKESPWPVARYRLTAEQCAMGRELYREALRLIGQATSADEWAGYSPESMPLQMPAWAGAQHENLLLSLQDR